MRSSLCCGPCYQSHCYSFCLSPLARRPVYHCLPFLCLCLSVCLSVPPCLCLSVSVSVSLSLSLCFCFSLCLSVSLSLTLSISLCLSLSISLCLSFSVCLRLSVSPSPLAQQSPVCIYLPVALSITVFSSSLFVPFTPPPPPPRLSSFLSLCPSSFLWVYVPVFLLLCLSAPSLCFSVCLRSVFVCHCLQVFLYVSLSVFPSLCLSVSVILSFCLSLFVFPFFLCVCVHAPPPPPSVFIYLCPPVFLSLCLFFLSISVSLSASLLSFLFFVSVCTSSFFSVVPLSLLLPPSLSSSPSSSVSKTRNPNAQTSTPPGNQKIRDRREAHVAQNRRGHNRLMFAVEYRALGCFVTDDV